MIGLPPRLRAAPRMKSTWPPMPEKKRPSERVGGDLTGEVDRQRRVDRDHPVVAGDDRTGRW